MVDYPLASTPVTLFVVLAWLAAALGTSAIAWIYARRRYLFVKPSMLLLAAVNVLFQWPMAIWAGFIEEYLPDPFAAFVLVHGFTFVGLGVACMTWRRTAAETWDRITDPRASGEGRVRAIVLLLAVSTVIALWYFSVNPLTSTGLFLTLTAPELAAEAREASFKDLSSMPLRYGFTTFLGSIGPLLGVLLALEFRARMGRGRPLSLVVIGVLIVLVILMMSVTGARGFAVTLLLALALGLYIRAGMPFKPVRTLTLIFAIVIPAAILTILRQGQEITAARVVEYTTIVVLERVLVGPEEVALWYVHFAQTYGPFGIAAVPKLAALVGVQGVNAPNIIGIAYAPFIGDYVNANASFVLTYYSYFGAIALVLTIGCLVLLDSFVVLYRWIAPALLLPCVAVTGVSSLALLSADFHTVLISNGLVTTPLIAVLLGRATGGSWRNETKQAGASMQYNAAPSSDN